MLVIEKSAKPYCFRHVNKLPTLYRAQASSWMDSAIFVEYLNRLEKRFISEKINCILFIDNCRAHPPLVTLNHLKALKVVFFPPNNTSFCQPMDMGIIANLKLNYRNYLAKQKNVCLKNSAEFKINILDAMTTFLKSWDDVKVTTIQNCFRKAHFVKLNEQQHSIQGNIDITQDQITRTDDDFLQICDENEACCIEYCCIACC